MSKPRDKDRARVDGRFAKGMTGNPKGRPRKSKSTTSAFDIVIERTLNVSQSGKSRELGIDEALQQKTFNDAMGGSRMAQRAVLKMIEKREAWLEKRHTRHPVVSRRLEYPENDNATEAALLLGIASREGDELMKTSDRVRLEAWAVEAALERRRSRVITELERRRIRATTRNASTLGLDARVRP